MQVNRTRTIQRGITATVLAVSALVIAACAAGPAPAPTARGQELPDWYLNPSAVYPDEVYLTAVGTGDTRRAAEQQAMAGLSQIFEAEIEVDMTTRERYRDIMTGSGTLSETEVELAQTTSVRSAQNLLNVQMGEAAVDESGRVHAIAYIERIPTGRLYVDLIEKNGEQVRYFLDQARTSESPVRAYAWVSAAAIVATGNELLRDQLRIIAPAMGQIIQLPYVYEDVLQERVDGASRMRVSVAVDGDEGDRVGGTVRQALGRERFPISSDNPVLRVTGRVSVEEVALSDDFETARWVLNLAMSGPDGVELLSYDDQGRASAVTIDSAKAFAYRDVQQAVEQNFVGAMRRYFDSLVLGD